MVTIVLLKEACTCATPSTTCLVILRFVVLAFLAIMSLLQYQRYKLGCSYTKQVFAHQLLAYRLTGSLTGTRVSLGTLTAQRQSFSVPNAAVATEVHQTFDIHRHFSSQVALDHHF